MMVVVIGLILAMVWTGSYRSVERVAIVFGLFELAFIVVAWRAGPHPSADRSRELSPGAAGRSEIPLPGRPPISAR